ncbi:AtuA-related protein [Effusibacillus dendaii]|uniref:AtuA-like ferredoxin-fold domain-containing protein n=1 Tax=Effusibacillus dendaii TaxID=2743772 RepID=A0A7I8DAY4_9BACL|nr:hypothetical protein [Effusibacillus dendaii]BCJ86119.1 hypothetical protein skT53_11040 [Effusibacillus dendaii]
MANMQLRYLAQARSGDKGNTVNVALFAPNDDLYHLFVEQVTCERVKAHFAGLVEGEVTRYLLPNVRAINFICREALNGGGSASIRMDNLGKCFSSNLLRMEVKVPDNSWW